MSGTGTDAQPGSRDALDVRYSLAELAEDYTKRKHVVRVTTAAGAELLLQVCKTLKDSIFFKYTELIKFQNNVSSQDSAKLLVCQR